MEIDLVDLINQLEFDDSDMQAALKKNQFFFQSNDYRELLSQFEYYRKNIEDRNRGLRALHAFFAACAAYAIDDKKNCKENAIIASKDFIHCSQKLNAAISEWLILLVCNEEGAEIEIINSYGNAKKFLKDKFVQSDVFIEYRLIDKCKVLIQSIEDTFKSQATIKSFGLNNTLLTTPQKTKRYSLCITVPVDLGFSKLQFNFSGSSKISVKY